MKMCISSKIFYFWAFLAHCTMQQVLLLNVNDNNGDIEEIEDENSNSTDASQTGGVISNDTNLVGFHLYPSSENTNYSEEILIFNQSSLFTSSFRKANPVTILIHGFLNNHTTRFSRNMKDAFLQCGYSVTDNIVLVNWGRLSTPTPTTHSTFSNALSSAEEDMYYQTSVKNVPLVGRRIADFILWLHSINYIEDLKNVYVIGFSLGAHVAGFTGQSVLQNSSIPIGRITGLDPASPMYQQSSLEEKLDSSDAMFVDVIHTNQGQEGYSGNLGHADFYPNGGGPSQPGCSDTMNSSVVTNTISGTCAHHRAWQYYVQSMKSSIQACKCKSNMDFVRCRHMCREKEYFGINCSSSARGVFYLDITE